MATRPPIVVILGHVDSGKTSILDYIRKTHVAAKESGGITQHIGAYQVEHKGKKITFIDTPGHEAFSAMRSRGAKAADIAVLVVDSCKGVEPQTKEAISHIKKAGLPLIAALNKIDRPEAEQEKAKRELAKEDILVETFGGKVPSVGTSTITGKGIDELLDMISLIGEMENLTADIAKPAEGWILESHLDSRSGITVVLISNQGVLKPGHIIGTPSAFGKIKSLKDFQGKQIESVLPSDPAIVSGFESLPKVGENFKNFSDIESARQNIKKTEEPIIRQGVVGEGQKVLNIILKADCSGSLEAIEAVLKEIPQDKIILKTLKSEAGELNESDIKLAKGFSAKILAFRVKASPLAEAMALREKIRLMNFETIYDLVEGVRKFMEGKVEQDIVRTNLGKLRVLVNFSSEKNRQVLGANVLEGMVEKGSQVEAIRNEQVAGKGKIINLQKNKKDAPKVQKGEECGLLFEGDIDNLGEGDILIVFKEERIKGEL